MKRKWYAVILGLVALSGLILWRGQIPRTPVQDGARSTDAPTKPIEGPSAVVQTAKAERATGRFWGRLGADLTIMLAEGDAIRRDEMLQVIVDSVAFDDIPAALQFFQRQEHTQVLQDLQVLLIRKGAATDPKAAAA